MEFAVGSPAAFERAGIVGVAPFDRVSTTHILAFAVDFNDQRAEYVHIDDLALAQLADNLCLCGLRFENELHTLVGCRSDRKHCCRNRDPKCRFFFPPRPMSGNLVGIVFF